MILVLLYFLGSALSYARINASLFELKERLLINEENEKIFTKDKKNAMDIVGRITIIAMALSWVGLIAGILLLYYKTSETYLFRFQNW